MISHKASSNSDRFQGVERQLFRACMWLLVFASFGAVGTKAIWGKPSAVPVHYLLAFVVIGAVLARITPALTEYAATRLHKVKFGGFEVELSEAAGQASLRLKIDDIPAWDRSLVDEAGGNLPYDNPFPSVKLTGPGLYEYERLSLRLYLLFDQVKDPKELDLESRENFRRLILHVGKAAYAMQHYTKALEVLLWLKRFTDRERDHEESKMLGTAYLWAADEQTDELQQRSYKNDAILHLRSALSRNPYQTVVLYNLGWALLSLEKYNNGIRQMRKCIRIEPRYLPWANWNIACGLKRLDRESDALKTLAEIPPGPWWKGIVDDDWFKDPEETPFMNQLKALAQTRTAPQRVNLRPDMFC